MYLLKRIANIGGAKNVEEEEESSEATNNNHVDAKKRRRRGKKKGNSGVGVAETPKDEEDADEGNLDSSGGVHVVPDKYYDDLSETTDSAKPTGESSEENSTSKDVSEDFADLSDKGEQEEKQQGSDMDVWGTDDGADKSKEGDTGHHGEKTQSIGDDKENCHVQGTDSDVDFWGLLSSDEPAKVKPATNKETLYDQGGHLEFEERPDPKLQQLEGETRTRLENEEDVKSENQRTINICVSQLQKVDSECEHESSVEKEVDDFWGVGDEEATLPSNKKATSEVTRGVSADKEKAVFEVKRSDDLEGSGDTATADIMETTEMKHESSEEREVDDFWGVGSEDDNQKVTADATSKQSPVQNIVESILNVVKPESNEESALEDEQDVKTKEPVGNFWEVGDAEETRTISGDRQSREECSEDNIKTLSMEEEKFSSAESTVAESDSSTEESPTSPDKSQNDGKVEEVVAGDSVVDDEWVNRVKNEDNQSQETGTHSGKTDVDLENRQVHRKSFINVMKELEQPGGGRRRSAVLTENRERERDKWKKESVSEMESEDAEDADEGPEHCIMDYLGKENDKAEARLAARRQARVEAREIRMRELERQQKEQEESGTDMAVVARPMTSPRCAATNHSSYHSSRRSSEDSVEDSFSIRDMRHELKEVDDKFRKAMIANAQLDNEKSAVSYQVELLKDKLEDLEENYSQLGREHRDKCREHEQLKRVAVKLREDLEWLKAELSAREEMIRDYGLVIVETEAEETEGAEGGGVRRSLVSLPAAELLKQGSGSLDVRLRQLAEERNDLMDQLRHVKLELEEERVRARGSEGKAGLGAVDEETCKALADYRFRTQRAEQDIATLQANVARLESQVIRYKTAAETSEKAEEELKIEKRKLQRENRESIARIEELETSNSHLQRRMDKLKNAKSTLLKEL